MSEVRAIVSAVTALVQLRRHVTRLRGCTACPEMIGPVVTGTPVVSPVMMIGQAPGVKEGPAGKPFAWTAGKTLFQWYASIGIDEEPFRARAYMAAVARCFPGKAEGGTGDRVPDAEEIERCSKHLVHEVQLIRPRLIIPIGKLAIQQMLPPEPVVQPASGRRRAPKPTVEKLVEVIGMQRRITYAGVEMDMIALPHPSGASTWHRTEPGKSLLARALSLISQHEAWKAIIDPPAHSFDAPASL